jgi:N-acyl-D-amino-acid deacylase
MRKSIVKLSALLLLAASPLAAQSDTRYDIVIRNGRVLDGAGNPWIAADVAIKDGRIVKVGAVAGKGAREIDARNRYVTPGFIDMMDSSGTVFLKSGAAENKLRQGVTTLISGEGGPPVPADQITAYFDRLEKQGIAVNFGTYYSGMQARQKIVGDADVRPTPAQMALMVKEVETAMRQGALGISSALMYAGHSYQTAEDLITLSKVVSKCGGFYASHIRDESENLIPAINEAIRIGEEGGVKVEIFHLKAAFRPGWGKLMPQAIATIEAARARGVDIAADMYPYPAAGTTLAVTVPKWIWADGYDKGMERLRDPALRARLKKESAAGSVQDWANPLVATGGWQNVVLDYPNSAKYARFAKMSMDKVAVELKQDPADAAWDILLAAQPGRASAFYFMIGEADIELAMRRPWVSIGSDGPSSLPGAVENDAQRHPRDYATMARIISEYVVKRKVLSLEEAVRKMTSWPAQRMGLSDRGLIREGMRADVAVFDPANVKEKATFDQPLQFAEGMDAVIVNGQIALDGDRLTGSRSGIALRHECPALQQ